MLRFHLSTTSFDCVHPDRADKRVQDVFSLVSAVTGIVTNLLKKYLDKVQDNLPPNDVLGKATLLGFLDSFSCVLNRCCKCIDVGRAFLEAC